MRFGPLGKSVVEAKNAGYAGRMANVFLGCPTRSRQVDWGFARSIWKTATAKHGVDVGPGRMTLLPTNCNRLLATALGTMQAKGYEWFAMLHDDIEPAPFWLDTLIDEANEHSADFISVVVPIKDLSGATSTAIAKSDSNYGYFCRLTMQQLSHPSFPRTFGIAEAVEALAVLPEQMQVIAPHTALLANTGCMVYRLAHWRPGVTFAQEDDIQLINGEWLPVWQSEDWVFTRNIAAHGGKVMATSALRVIHHGIAYFESASIWGNPRDLG